MKRVGLSRIILWINISDRAASSSADREPSRFAAAPTAPEHSGIPSAPPCSCALRAGTSRGPPQSLMQTCISEVRVSVRGCCGVSPREIPLRSISQGRRAGALAGLEHFAPWWRPRAISSQVVQCQWLAQSTWGTRRASAGAAPSTHGADKVIQEYNINVVSGVLSGACATHMGAPPDQHRSGSIVPPCRRAGSSCPAM